MSVFATAWAQQQRAGDTRSKHVLHVLADFADESGYSFPSIATLARITEQSRKSIERCLDKLVDRGLIRIKPQFDATGRRTSNGYYLLAPKDALAGPDKLHRPLRPEPKSAPAEKTMPTPVENPAGGMRQFDGVTPPTVTQAPATGDGEVCANVDGGYASTVTGAESTDPSDDPSKRKNTARARATPPAGEAWEAFWTAYPHPRGDPSKPAHEEWCAVVEAGADPATIIEAAKAYGRGKPRWQSPVQAVRWLHEGRWCDWVRASTTARALTEPQFASNVDAAHRQWLAERWPALRKTIGAVKFDLFVGKLTVVEVTEDKITFTAPSRFIRDTVDNDIVGALKRLVSRLVVIDLAQPPVSNLQQKGQVA